MVDRALAIALAPGRGRVTHVRRVPARPARGADLPGWVHPDVAGALAAGGVRGLWAHQRAGADLLHAGRHTVVATGTASGKSLAYLLPALSDVAAGTADVSGRGATALYLAPTKALAADQAARVAELRVPGVRCATYDGDTPSDERRAVRRHASYVLTNPDMLHHGILPGHAHWGPFLRALRYVIVDECHTYRGVFGSHLAALLRRLRRVCAAHGSSPTFALASATVSRPGELAEALVGAPVEVVDDDGSPHGATTYVFLDPHEEGAGPANSSNSSGSPSSASTLGEAGRLLADLVRAGSAGGGNGASEAAAERPTTTAVFARSRVGVEVVADRVAAELAGHPAAGRVAAYRGGYLPEERRELEAALRSGRLAGVATTSALELGIDVAGLDVVVLAGWPGTTAAFRQRAGRAGRSGGGSLVVFLAGEDPLDAYLVDHPGRVLDEPVEACVLDPANPYVLAAHLTAAAAEVPLTPADAAWFGPTMRPLLDGLVADGRLRRRPTGWFWTAQERPTDGIPLRGTGDIVRIVEADTGRVVGTIDAPRADVTVHRGAVYLHQQQTYVVTDLDLDDGAAQVVAGDPGWSTQARTVSAFDLVTEDARAEFGPVTLSFGSVAVRSRATSFVRRARGGAVLGEHPLDSPERTLHTRGVWWTVSPEAAEAAGVGAAALPGAAHAAEHAAIGLLPLVATADRWDIGGVSTALHPDTGLPTILVYDGHPGGAGIAERGHAAARAWWAATRAAIADCRCAAGCPSCVQSPKCGNGNEPLDKAGAVALIDVLLAHLPEG